MTIPHHIIAQDQRCPPSSRPTGLARAVRFVSVSATVVVFLFWLINFDGDRRVEHVGQRDQTLAVVFVNIVGAKKKIV